MPNDLERNLNIIKEKDNTPGACNIDDIGC